MSLCVRIPMAGRASDGVRVRVCGSEWLGVGVCARVPMIGCACEGVRVPMAGRASESLRVYLCVFTCAWVCARVPIDVRGVYLSLFEV